jgi:PAS domain S-box/diguanylate cyclase (GGDEF) domain
VTKQDTRPADTLDELVRGVAQLLEQAPGFVAIFAGPDHVVRFANASFRRLVGERDIIGRPLRDCLPELEGQGYFAMLDAVYARGEGVIGEGLTAMVRSTADGALEQRHVDFTCQPLRGPDGEVQGVFVEGHDVTARKRAEQERNALLAREQAARRELEIVNERLRTAQRIARVGSWEHRLEDDSLIWSDEVYRILGLTPGSDCERLEVFMSLVHPEDRQKLREEYDRALRGDGRVEYEYRIIRPDGEVRILLERAEVRCDSSGRVVAVSGTVQDITERRAAEERLRRSEALVQIAGRVARLGGWALDLADPDPRFEWSDEVCAIYEVPVGTRPTMEEVLELCAPEWRVKLIAAFESCLREGVGFDLEVQVLSASGRRLWVRMLGQAVRDEHGRVTRLEGALQDVTAPRAAQETLRKSEERFAIVAKATSDAIWDWNLENDTVWWNDGMQKLFGYSAAELEPDSRSWTERIHPDDAERIRASIQSFIEGTEANWVGEYRFRRKDGSYASVLDRAFLVRDSTGRPVRMVGSMEDISQQKLAEERIRASEARLREMADNIEDMFYSRTADCTRLFYVSPGFERIFGRSCQSLYEDPQSLVAAVLPEDRPTLVDGMQRLAAGEQTELYYRILRPDGEVRWVRSRSYPVLNEQGQVERVVGSVRDITERKRAERQAVEHQRRLLQLAHHDSLTKLPSRLQLQSSLPDALERARRSGRLLALLYIDVDHFKHINDSQGHGRGDALLQIIAQRLRHTVGRHDVVVRMGGDEFVVVAGELPDRTAAESLAGRILDSLRSAMCSDGVTLSVTASIGISVFPDDGADPEMLLKHADIALYQAKERGRNTFQFFTPDMNSRLMERVVLEQALRRAIGTEQIYLEYQPIVDVASGTTVALEALLRWRHPELGAISPTRCVPVAEECGAIVELGNQVLRLACRQLDEWRRADVPLVPVCIDLSPKQLDRGRIQETVAELCREFELEPSLLGFEITESAVMQHVERHLAVLHSLRRFGCRIGIDDFGTGYSSLSYLKHLPINTVKIDRAFVRDMATDGNDVAIVSAIVAMAQTLGLRTVAEGVERPEQLAQLRELGCEFAQGYYLGRPMQPDAPALIERLRSSDGGSMTVSRRALRLSGGR